MSKPNEPAAAYVSHCIVDGLEPTDEGWYIPACECGWTWAPCPDSEIAADALMQHAYEQGVLDARAGRV